MKQVITIQHCQSIHHTNGMVGSWTDWDLSELGRWQAQNIAENLAPELAGQSIKIYSSDLKRAAQTAAPLAEKLGVEIEYRQELRERNLGEAVGKSVEWLRAHMVPEPTIDSRMFPGSHSRREVWQRLDPFCQEVQGRPEDTVVLVSHGETLGMWNFLWLQLEPAAMERVLMWGKAGGVSCFEIEPDGRRKISRMGDLSYIRPPAES